MDLRCFVRVLTDEPAGVAGGTGYLVSRDRVLTAAHVVGEADRVSIEYDEDETRDVVGREATVHWRGDETCDVALLLLAEPVALDVALPRLADTPIDTLTSWESRGWARAGDDEPLVRDSMVGLHGDVSAFAADQKRAQLTVDVHLASHELWRGASGAPVFELGTDRILGVAAEVLRAAENVWHASPLSAAFIRADFLDSLGGEIVRVRRDRLIAEVTGVLGKSPDLVEALASCHEGWRRRDAGGLADTILATDVIEALTRLNSLHTRLCRQQVPAARQVEEIVALIAPVLVQRRVLHALPNETGGVWLRLPVTTPTVAELAVAVFDGRPSALRSYEDDDPDGRSRLPQPPAEVGFDIDGNASLRGYAEHFAKQLLTRQGHAVVERERKRKGEESARDLIFDLVNDEIEFQAEHGEPPLRHYLLYDDQFARDHQPFLAQLRRRVRAMHLVEMTGDDPRGELRICQPLRAILARAAATEIP